jgi:hypothetical protein
MSNRFKLNIILDLDQTCISAEDFYEFDEKKYKSKISKFSAKPINMDDAYIVFQRPHLQEFLDFIFTHFNISVWTAASPEYGLFIIKNIICPPNSKRQLDFFLHSKHCSESKKKGTHCKDLDMLYNIWKLPGYYHYNTIIIDDLKEVFTNQPMNCISIKEFNFTSRNSENDTALLKVIDQLKLLVKYD